MSKNESQFDVHQYLFVSPTQVALSSSGPPRRRRRETASPVGVVHVTDEPFDTGAGDGPFNADGLAQNNDGTISTVSRGDGAIATGAPVQLIFWGSIWNDPSTSPSAADLIGAVQNILGGAFMSGLLQYGINRSPFRGAIVVTAPEPPLAPNTFDEQDLQDEVVGALIAAGTFPEPDEDGGRNIYVVMMPPNTKYDGDQRAIGAHNHFSSGSISDVDNAWYAWIRNGPIEQMTRAFGHELAETCTDPEGDGLIVDGNQEIGDVCTKRVSQRNGVTLEGYWSALDNACLLPINFSLRRFLRSKGLDFSHGVRSLIQAGTSVRTQVGL